jgi:hypothetical protein
MGRPLCAPISGSPSMRTVLHLAPRGTWDPPAPEGCNVVTSTDPVIDTPVPENTPALQTIPTIMVLMTTSQPEMELIPDQQQAYQEEQQARARTRQVDGKLWVAQCHNERWRASSPQPPDDRAALTQGCARDGASRHHRLHQSLRSGKSHHCCHQQGRYATPHLSQGQLECSCNSNTFGYYARALYR